MLTLRKIEKLKTPGRYLDAHNLYLEVFSATNRHWLFRYVLNGRERHMGLGAIHTITLDEAREAARSARKLLREKIDPIEKRLAERDAQRADERSRVTFKAAAEDFISLHEQGWKNEKHRAQWRSTLEAYAYPKIGARPVNAIDIALVNEVVAPLWVRIPKSAARVRDRINRVIAWVREGRPLPTNTVKLRTKNYAAVPYKEIPAFMQDLRGRQGVSPRALEFLILCAARSGEVLGAQWDEINLSEAIWTIAPERMKSGREHRVPLSERSVQILKELPREDDNDCVFIGGKKGRGLSSMALVELMRGLKPGYVPHGFRSTFKDWAADLTAYPNIVSEMALAHTVKGVEAHYRRSDLLEKRRRLMNDWSKYCNVRMIETENVVGIRGAA